MDWLDNYLDGLGQYKVTVSPADTHVWGVKPKLNNVQQKMLFDAAAQSELEYRLLVQEARQAEIDAGMGGSYDAGSAAREGQVTPSATVPDAPVLTSIGSGNAELSAFFTAPANNGGSIITNYKYSSNAGSSFTTRSPASTASPIKITGLTNGTEYDVRIRAVNSIGDGSISNALSGTPSAPAPSGIPVSTTNIAITYNGQTRNLEKISDTSWYNPQGGQNDSGACEITRFALQYANSRWEFSTYFNTLDEGNCSTGSLELQSTNAGASSSIPVSDWSTSITITTAPSGIVVATANAIVLSGITGVYSDLNGTYTKSGDPTSVTAGGVEGEATGAVFFNSAYTGGNKNGAAIWYGPIPFSSFTGWAITYENDNRFVAGFIASSRTTEVPVSGYSNTVGYTGTITLTAA